MATSKKVRKMAKKMMTSKKSTKDDKIVAKDVLGKPIMKKRKS